MDNETDNLPESNSILDEAQLRHAGPFAFAFEAIRLGYIAYDRQRELTAHLIPGIPSVPRSRFDINDDIWRFYRAIADPLVEDGAIREFTTSGNGGVAIMSDGLRIRVKKGNRSGATSNYPTQSIVRSAISAAQYALFPDCTKLDQYIQEGLGIDVVFVAGRSISEFDEVGIRLANVEDGPLVIIDPPTDDQLMQVSPEAYDCVVNARDNLFA